MEKDYDKLLGDARQLFNELFVLAMVHYEEINEKTKQTLLDFVKTYGR